MEVISQFMQSHDKENAKQKSAIPVTATFRTYVIEEINHNFKH